MSPLSKSAPPSLKKIVVFLRRAEELDHDKSPESRVVAYNCRQYAVLTGIPLAGTDATAKSCLGKLLDELEKEKSAMSTFSKAEHWAICRKVADRVFDKADGEDRAGLADKGTAKTFYAAGTFYEILQQFYPENKDGDDEMKDQIEEEEQKRLYCKWKATDILNAIKEGREPTPGGYQQQQSEEDAPVTETIESTTIAESFSNKTELAPPPQMPPSDFFVSNTEDKESDFCSEIVPPPSYDNVELNINGSLVENSHIQEESDDIFIPAAPKNEVLPTCIPSPPSYSETSNFNSIPPSSEQSIPAAPISPPKSSSGFSSLFGKSNTNKISKNQMNDAVELTKFALAALQKGDGELGRQRLEQALGVLNK
jgi:vacuolar protein sorting-associated protein VTA1